MIITSVIPPELPMELSMAVNASLVALAKKKVFCTEPFRIPFAGKVEVCCFDKTGTLTSDHLLLEEVVVPSESSRPNAHRVMATCHSLVHVPSGENPEEKEIIGDPLETAVLEAVEWSYAEGVARNPNASITATILHHHRLAPNSHPQIPTSFTPSHLAHDLLQITQAVEWRSVADMVLSAPSNYDQLYKQYAAQGSRVIALAYRELGSEQDLSPDEVKALTRDQVEAQMTWAGFAVLLCPLKSESEPALAQLRASSHQLVMITGDAPLTACYAASKGGVHEDTDADYVWVSPDEQIQVPFSREFSSLVELASQYDLCLSGDALTYAHSLGLSPSIVPLCQVYARVSPEQKELIVKTMRGLGRTLLMCGDGTNDVGGLKAAHVGVALLSASESVNRSKKESKAKAKGGKAGKGGTPGTEVAPAESTKKKPMGKGQKNLEALRARGRTITPRMEEFAKYMDSLEEEEGMLKPGKLVNLSLLMYMYHLAYKETPEKDRLKPDSEFKPNLVNSVTYMVEAMVQLSTFTVNYMGHPFNNSISENKIMFNVLKWMAIFLGVVLFNLVPGNQKSPSIA
ncbi:HAD-like domain-containing protein [Dunaliella salina]|uniref:HAD-like domain-containing protein n=1 Tax=Dunaliella salina TaxID=3046 RepID=A0ABQ7H8D4_DUNSA|nr:HAD-like domain-containing protein [Dunaliella salina]|eukprot:KAF5843111.1 HAD-like domain-containing protein [Dunaliella salina]